VAAPDWLAIVEEAITVRLDPQVLAQIEKDTLGFTDRLTHDGDIIYKLSSQDLLQVLASSVGMSPLSQGAIIIWTYYNNLPQQSENQIKNESDGADLSETNQSPNQSPMLRTLINVDGDLSQKVCQDLLQHPLGDRIVKAHGFIISQISRQLLTAIADYVEMKLRPMVIASISMVTVFAWCDPLQKLGENIHLPDAVIGNCWGIIITTPVTVLIIWWLLSKLPLQLDLPKSMQRFSKNLLYVLESRVLQIVAIAIITILLLGWLAVTFILPVDAQLGRLLRNVQSYAEPYLPIAVISLRKLIISNLSKIFLRSSFLVKLLFGRFLE
jgi:hypothetical protein